MEDDGAPRGARRGEGEARPEGDRERSSSVVDAERRAVEAKLQGAFASRANGPAALAPLLPLLGELRFYRRFLDEVSAIEDAIAEAAVARA